jgi:hypothetical protein
MKDYLAVQGCVADAKMLGEDSVAPIDDEEHMLFSCERTKDIRLYFAGMPMSILRDTMQCDDVSSVAWFVYK